MTPRDRERRGHEIAEEQVAHWETEGVGYPVMLWRLKLLAENLGFCSLASRLSAAHFPSRGVVVAMAMLVWLKMGAA